VLCETEFLFQTIDVTFICYLLVSPTISLTYTREQCHSVFHSQMHYSAMSSNDRNLVLYCSRLTRHSVNCAYVQCHADLANEYME